jgi:hypothetical protein
MQTQNSWERQPEVNLMGQMAILESEENHKEHQSA